MRTQSARLRNPLYSPAGVLIGAAADQLPPPVSYQYASATLSVLVLVTLLLHELARHWNMKRVPSLALGLAVCGLHVM
eukprot:COSAG04_NODE_2609_length_3859_cov_13.516223_6_plen_78_part_00